MKMTLDPDLAMEAKALVALAFRNGPIEDLHAGKPCLARNSKTDVSHISDDEMKAIMKSAVDAPYRLLWKRDYDPRDYQEDLALGRRFIMHWDDPELKRPAKRRPRLK